MKIKTNISAGMTFEECDAQRDWWKTQAGMMEEYYNGNVYYPPTGLWYPCSGTPAPAPAPIPTGGGYVDGVWYPDMSGTCG